MAGQHDDRHVGIGVGAGLTDHLGQFEPVEVGITQSVRMMSGIEWVKASRPVAVLGFIDFAGAEAVQQRAQDAPHMGVVVDDEETQTIEVDANHAPSAAAARRTTSVRLR